MPTSDEEYSDSSEYSDEDEVEEAWGLDQEKIREARRLTQFEAGMDPIVAFRERAELRERYHDVIAKVEDAKANLENNGDDEIFTEAGVQELENALKQADDDYKRMGASGKELNCDAKFLKSITDLVLSKFHKLHQANAERSLRPKDFAEKLRNMAEEAVEECPFQLESTDRTKSHLIRNTGNNPEAIKQKAALNASLTEDDMSGGHAMSFHMWAGIGRKYGHMLRIPPTLQYLRPLMQDTTPIPLEAKMKRERKIKEDKAMMKLVVLEEKAKDHDDPEQTVTKQLDAIRKCLKKAMKKAGKTIIPYYNFVINPDDFSLSIENMFYMTFLVKDGHIRVQVNEATGLPDIILLTNEEKSTLNVNDRSIAASQQAIVGFSYDIWEDMKEILEVTEAAIIR